MSGTPEEPNEPRPLDATRRSEDNPAPEMQKTRLSGAPLDRTRISASGSSPAPAAPVTRFGRYELQGEIARGGMGVVYRARQLDMSRTVALKVLLSGDFASEDEERRFIREAEMAAQLSHPNIVAVHDIGKEDGRRFFTMELVDGRPLDAWGKDKSLPDRLRVMSKICRAVHHAHMKGIIHRDLKPGNVLVTAEDEPKILDFGLAKATQPGAASMNTVSGAAIGTPYYMAPEQAAGRLRDIDIRTDVFTLGVMLYELIGGRLPFPGDSLVEVLQKIQAEDPNPLAAPVDLRLIAGKAMEKDKARRYATAEALAEDLERFLAKEPISARPPGLGFLAKRWLRRHPAMAASAGVAAVALAAVAVWQFTRPGTFQFAVDPADSWVEVDGVRVLSGTRKPAGRYGIVAGRDGYETETKEGVDLGRGETRTIAFNLRPSGGRLTVECDTEGAIVIIAGEAHGTPVTNLPLDVGDYEVRIRKKGFLSRSRTVTVRRNASTTAWISLPGGGSWFQPIPDGTAQGIWPRDVNGDGVQDWVNNQYYQLGIHDGLTGKLIRHTPMADGVFTPELSRIDVDGDGVEDDLVYFHLGDAPTPGRVIRVQAWSGREVGEPVATRMGAGGSGLPAQKRLWEREYPLGERECFRQAVVPVGGVLWVIAPGGAERLDPATGRTLGAVEEAPVRQVFALEGTPDAVIFAGNSVFRAGPAGGLVWKTEIGSGVWGTAVLPLTPLTPLTRPPFPIVGTTATEIFALAPEDGRRLWSRPMEGGAAGRIVVVVPGPTGLGDTTVLSIGPGDTTALDAENGREFPGPALVLEDYVRFTGIRGRLYRIDGASLECLSPRTGERLWTRTFASRLLVPLSVAETPSGIEVLPVTDTGILTVLDEEGRELREYALAVPMPWVRTFETNGDGRTDYVILGSGIHCIPSTRVIWKRPWANAVRPRPSVLSRGGRPALAILGRWDNSANEARCLDATTGEVLWRAGQGFDCIFEPLVADADGDGSTDLCAQGSLDGRTTGFYAFSGIDGHVLESWPVTGSSSYMPGVLVDVDGDGRREVILCPQGVGVAAYQAGRREPIWAVPSGSSMAGAAVRDCDGDGTPEILATWSEADRASGWVAAITMRGKLLWKTGIPEYVRSTVHPTDLEGDGRGELLVAGRADLHILALDGKIQGRWAGLGASMYPPVETDVDGDGRAELLIGGTDGLSLVQRDGSRIWRFPAKAIIGAVAVADLPAGRSAVGADRDGMLFVVDLKSGRPRWTLKTGALCEGGVALADADGDGVPEAYFGSYDFNLYAVDLR